MTYNEFIRNCDTDIPVSGGISRRTSFNDPCGSGYVPRLGSHTEFLKQQAALLETRKNDLIEARKNKDEKKAQRIEHIIKNIQDSMQRVREHMALPRPYGL